MGGVDKIINTILVIMKQVKRISATINQYVIILSFFLLLIFIFSMSLISIVPEIGFFLIVQGIDRRSTMKTERAGITALIYIMLYTQQARKTVTGIENANAKIGSKNSKLLYTLFLLIFFSASVFIKERIANVAQPINRIKVISVNQ